MDERDIFRGSGALLERLYAESQAERFNLPRDRFIAALDRAGRKRFAGCEPGPGEVEAFLRGLHLEDLALACACCEGIVAAWERFVPEYRGYLRNAAAAILRCSTGSAEAAEFADSLFAELYGLADGKRAERSLFRYFHGRSSLKTWLRAVLAQRRIDAVRAGRKFESLDGPDGEAQRVDVAGATPPLPLDPDREWYVKLFTRALEAGLARLAARDRERLQLYYAQEQTLAETGRELGEHESSVSRNLERIRRELRQSVEEALRTGEIHLDGHAKKGLSEAQIALCFEYAAGETPIDLNKLLPEKPVKTPQAGKREG